MVKRRVRRLKHPLGDPRRGESHAYEMKIGNRWLRHGEDVKIRGRRGTYRFVRLVEHDTDGRLPEVWLWDDGGAYRFVRPEVLKIAPKRRQRLGVRR